MSSESVPPPSVPDWAEVLEFVKRQGKDDREYFKHLFDVFWRIGLALLAIAGALAVFFNVKTTDDIERKAREATQNEVENMRREVRSQIEAEFKKEQIEQVVREVAKERAQERLIRSSPNK